ncbi:centromere protein U isoform X2 [Sphaeramia orbicularis]|uniref:centromere protein U isoform X2 n=1 Tax=Sphaeramia orbicularis TaxID=375764 RepID=UPI0011816C96|nr:centromere protein U isoform X2 [Sphaeramia orbicularis]
MSTKKTTRGKKVKAVAPQTPLDVSQVSPLEKASSVDHLESADLSAIARASFMEGMQQNFGNPLHSTAMDEDLNVLENRQEDKGRATKRKRAPQEEKLNLGSNLSSAPQKSSQPILAASRQRKNPQSRNNKKKKTESEIGMSSDPQSQQDSDARAPKQDHKEDLSSDEEEGEQSSWKPSPKTARVSSLIRAKFLSNSSKSKRLSSNRLKSGKSSSGSGSGQSENTSSDELRKAKHHSQGGTELEVVLEAFLDFCKQYRESEESKTVKQSIDCFSSNVKEQLVEKISKCKELRVLTRENRKAASLIRKKTQRMLDAKNELIRAKRQLGLLQKEKAELEHRLADLTKSQTFLQDIRKLNKEYLNYRLKHPKEKETYGTSSLPALLLEAQQIQGVGRQLKGINNQLERTIQNYPMIKKS